MLLSHLLISILLTLTHGDDCPIFFDPLEVVVKYGDSVSVNCSTDIPHQGLRWDGFNTEVNMTEGRSSWTVDEMTDWEIQPSCVVISNETQCLQKLTITIYKTPDSVFISTGDNIMIEGSTYELQCDVVNVAPVPNLTVKWYKGETLMHIETFTDPIKTPVNTTSTLQITADRSDDGLQYRCEAELELGAEGPQPPPAVTSEPLNIIVYTGIDECTLLQFNPQRVVVMYGSSVSVDCSTNITHKGIGWEASEGPVPMTRDKNLITWRVQSLTQWDIQPQCFISTNMTKCVSLLPVVIYKTPDSVSISTGDNTMTEGSTYELQCDVVNVAPVQNLTVKWYKGETLMQNETFTDPIKTPVNTTSILQITADRSDDGLQYRCEAELELGAEGPQPPTAVTSEPLNIVVYSILQFNPQRVVVMYGSSVSVDCSTNITHKGIGWEASEGSVPMTRDKNLITWRVQSLTQWGIKPICYINYGPQCERILPITIYKTPDSVSINTADHTGPMTEGSTYELQCDVVNVAPVQNLTVKWYKGETLMQNETFTDPIKTPVNTTSILQITADRSDDGLQYRCEAELELGAEGPQPPPAVTSEPLNITVYYKPQIHFCNHWAPKIESTLSLYPTSYYSIVTNPSANISWSRGSSSLNASIFLDKYDSGEYKITASNEHGASSCIINITVEYPPGLNCNESFQIQERTLFKLPCSVDGVPEPGISLYKNGKLIPFPYSPSWNDSALYNLTASNKYGSVYHPLQINILYAPVFDPMNRNIEVVADGNITLNCSSSGNPEPHMWWSFKNANISTGGRYVTINILKATSTDSGEYICSATNRFGHNSKTFSVEIKENSSPRHIFPVYIFFVLVALILIILLCLYLWRKRKSSGQYQIQTDQELRPLSNGGPT